MSTQAGSLQRLLRLQPHDIFVTNLRFSSHNAVVTCAGDNTNTFTPLPPDKLKPISLYVWLSMLVALVAVAIALLNATGLLDQTN